MVEDGDKNEDCGDEVGNKDETKMRTIKRLGMKTMMRVMRVLRRI